MELRIMRICRNSWRKKGREAGCEVTVFQSNHEGAIIDRLQEAYFDRTDGISHQSGRLHPLQLCHQRRACKHYGAQGGDPYFRYHEKRGIPENLRYRALLVTAKSTARGWTDTSRP